MSGPTISPAVLATSRDTLAIARIAARKGRAADLTNTVRERFGIELPTGPKRVQANELAFIGVGVATWLALSECELADNGLDGFAASLRNIVDESATVSDQIGGYSVLRLTGRRVTQVLAKFVALDLHPQVFVPGSAASTIGSHIPLTLWRLEDSSGGLAVFELAVPRSYTTDFRHLLSASAAEFAAAAG
jgi:heterotetrameric sarcosine oxidase gamma subunit